MCTCALGGIKSLSRSLTFDYPCKCLFVPLYSETLKQWDRSVEVPTMPDAESTVYQDAQHDEDNETEISEYLTLAQLGSILRELAIKGKIYL